MIKITAPGLVIREQSIGEADRLITVLTAQYGIVRAFSRGAKKTKSKLGGIKMNYKETKEYLSQMRKVLVQME